MKLTRFFLVASLVFSFVLNVIGIEVDTTLTRFDYDLGKTSSPVKSGWLAITPETSGDISWSASVSAADRGDMSGTSDVTRDFIYSRNTITLNHKIANGDWVITLEMGDVGTGDDAARDMMKVVAEGKTIGSGISTSPGEIKTIQGSVTVTDGELNITISDEGGSNPYWVWNRLSISQKPLPGTTGTLHHPNGEILRAAPMTFGKRYPGPVKWAKNINTWWEFKDLHYNAIRLPWVDAKYSAYPTLDVWTWDELHVELDKIVENATATDMCVVINYHLVGEQDDRYNPNGPDYEMKWLEEFWVHVASWYKDNPLVIYELQNEPAFSYSKMTKPEFKTRFLEIYRKVRELAPERQIIVFSSPHHSYISELMDFYENDLDWDYTIAGYHLYNGGTTSNIQAAAKKHRVVCTEWDYSANRHSYVRPVDGYKEGSETLERIGQGWMDWSQQNGPFYAHSELNADAISKGYNWWNISGTNIEWESPLSNSIIYEGDDVTVKVDVTDNGSINKCKLYLNGIFVEEDNAAPYEWNSSVLKDLAAGNYVVRIEVEDNEGNQESSTRYFTILAGTANKMKVLNPVEDAYVRNIGTQDGSGQVLLARHAHTSTNDHKSYLKFDLSEIASSSVGSANLRIYNNGDGAEGYTNLHELLNDSWSESTINWSNAPKNTGVLGQMREDRGGENAPEFKFSYKKEWIDFDVTAFVNQELGRDKKVSFQVSNIIECQDRFEHSNETDLLFSFDSRESENPPQLVLGNIGVLDTAKVTGVNIDSRIAMYEGQSLKLEANVLPVNSADKSVSWSSENTSVAMINENGKLNALAIGTTIITATTIDGGYIATCEVQVIGEDTKLSVSPVAYWAFDEISGKIVNDQIGSANGTWQNTTTIPEWTIGKVGGAAYFSGGDNDKFIVNQDPLYSCTEFTITGWFKMYALGSYVGLVTTRDLDGSQPLNWGFSAENSHIDSRWNSSAIDSKTVISADEWFHVAITWDSSGKQQLYINGELDSGSNSNVTEYVTDRIWWFGDDPCCSGRELNGYLDEVAMYNKVLSPDEVALIYSVGNSGNKLSSLDPLNTSSNSVGNNNECIIIYPNPAQSIINLRFYVPTSEVVLASIYTSTGQLVKQQSIDSRKGGLNNCQLNVDGLNNGMYILLLKSDSESVRGKFVIKR